MNIPIIDPLQGDFPEVIEEYLQHDAIKCIAFNRRGTLLAAGCYDGSCIIWDFETRVIAKELRSEDCVATITSVCWSKYGHHILVATAEKTLILWDVASGKRIAQTTLEKIPLYARLHPGSSSSYLCLACPLHSAPLMVNLLSGTSKLLPDSLAERGDGVSFSRQNKVLDDSALLTPACFNKHGDLVYLGTSKGEILIIDHHSSQVCALVPITGGAVIKNLTFSKSGQYFLTNSGDRILRVYENLLPVKDSLGALREMGEKIHDLDGVEKLKTIGSKCLVLSHEFQNSITRMHWIAPSFSRNGDWIIAGSAGKGDHKIYIWERSGCLVKILEAPKEPLIDLTWHPVRPIIVSVSLTGCAYIWTKDYAENWSAFAPDFTELGQCEEYVEREDEFDIMPQPKKMKNLDFNNDEEVDIITVENDSTFSDSDVSEEELCYLPAIPCPDSPEQEVMCSTDSLEAYHNYSASYISVKTGQHEQAASHESYSVEDNTTGQRSKRLRKPSTKFSYL